MNTFGKITQLDGSGRIFVGSRLALYNLVLLREIGITDVINCMELGEWEPMNDPTSSLLAESICIHHYPTQDRAYDIIQVHGDAFCTLVNSILEKSATAKVLVFCYGGHNRSVSLACYYYHSHAQRSGTTIEQMIKEIQIHRPGALHNPYFVEALQRLDT
jgi:protein-tyrosine phosphatase